MPFPSEIHARSIAAHIVSSEHRTFALFTGSPLWTCTVWSSMAPSCESASDRTRKAAAHCRACPAPSASPSRDACALTVCILSPRSPDPRSWYRQSHLVQTPVCAGLPSRLPSIFRGAVCGGVGSARSCGFSEELRLARAALHRGCAIGVLCANPGSRHAVPARNKLRLLFGLRLGRLFRKHLASGVDPRRQRKELRSESQFIQSLTKPRQGKFVCDAYPVHHPDCRCVRCDFLHRAIGVHRLAHQGPQVPR